MWLTLWNRTPAHFAAFYGGEDMLRNMLASDRKILEVRDHIGASLAHYAAGGGHEGVLEFLHGQAPDLVRINQSFARFAEPPLVTAK